MKASIFTISAAAALLSCNVLGAQNISGYLNSRYIHANEANPAFAPDCNKVLSLPGIRMDMHSNVGAYSLLYPSENGYVTGLHESVSAEQFLGRIGESAKLNASASVRLFGFGMKNGDGDYFSAALKIRGVGGGEIPADVFRLLKEGSETSDSFDLSGTRYNGAAMAELAFGWSHPFGPVNVGIRAKALYGIARSRMVLEQLDVRTESDRWAMQGVGFINSAKGGANLGGALDLGISARLGDNTTVSAAILDLGMISWAAASYYRLPGGQWEYVGSKNDIEIMDKEGLNGLSDETETAINDLRSKLEFVRDGEDKRESDYLPITVNTGFKYSLPSRDNISFGAVAAHRGGAMTSLTEIRAVADLIPAKWVELSVSAGYSSTGTVGGLLAVFDMGPVRAHLCAEMLGSRYGKYSVFVVPIDNIRIMTDLGIQIILGK